MQLCFFLPLTSNLSPLTFNLSLFPLSHRTITALLPHNNRTIRYLYRTPTLQNDYPCRISDTQKKMLSCENIFFVFMLNLN